MRGKKGLVRKRGWDPGKLSDGQGERNGGCRHGGKRRLLLQKKIDSKVGEGPGKRVGKKKNHGTVRKKGRLRDAWARKISKGMGEKGRGECKPNKKGRKKRSWGDGRQPPKV